MAIFLCFHKKTVVSEAKSFSNYKGNLGKVYIRPTKITITFFLGKILHRVFFYSIRILPMLQTSENELPSIILNTVRRAIVSFTPPEVPLSVTVFMCKSDQKPVLSVDQLPISSTDNQEQLIYYRWKKRFMDHGQS